MYLKSWFYTVKQVNNFTCIKDIVGNIVIATIMVQCSASGSDQRIADACQCTGWKQLTSCQNTR